MQITLLALSTVLLVSACATSPVQPIQIPGTAPPETDAIRIARQEAKVCVAPVVASPELSRTFKYGCFCGANHPDIQPESGESVSALSPARRADFIATYYRIKPIDALDRACQAHDICWILHGKAALSCNEQFRATLDYLWETFGSTESEATAGLNRRCASLALDMGAATLFLMEGSADDDPSSVGSFVGKLLNAPAATIYSALFIVGRSTFGEYPRTGEQCSLPLELGASELRR
jgi:hypothetical protein